MRWSLFALVFLSACEPRGSGCGGDGGATMAYCGLSLSLFFPFDGQRSWTFANDDATIPYHVLATVDPEFSTIEGGAVEVHTIHYAVDCFVDGECVDGDPFRVRSIQMSSDLSFGTLLHSVDLGDGGLETFDPPVMLTDGTGRIGDLWETDSNGQVWASVFHQKADCDVLYTDEWTDCLTLRVDDDADVETPPSAHPLHGEWVAVTGYNVVQFQWRDDPEPWRLLTQTWDAAAP